MLLYYKSLQFYLVIHSWNLVKVLHLKIYGLVFIQMYYIIICDLKVDYGKT